MSASVRWLCGLLLLAFPMVVGAQARPLASVPLRPYLGTALRTVDVVSGRDTLRLLLDTGGGLTVLTPAAAARVGCVPFGRIRGHRMSGEVVDFGRCPPASLTLGGHGLPHAQVGVFDLMALLPQGAPPLDGVLALSSLRPRVVTLRFDVDSLVIESVRSARAARRGMHELTMRMATGNDGSTLDVFLRAEIGGQDAWLLLDSGNIAGTLVAPHVARLTGVPGADSVGRRVSAELRFAPGVVFRDTVEVRDLIYDGALGMRFMAGRPLMIDLAAGRFWTRDALPAASARLRPGR